MKVTESFVLREIAGDYILVPVGNTALRFSGLITVNEVGSFLWSKIQKETTLEQLVDSVLDEYDIDRDTAQADTIEFLEHLKQAGILTSEIA